jgi:hypothetical protein
MLINPWNQPDENYVLPHPIWSKSVAESVKVCHRKPEGVVDHLAYSSVFLMRATFDLVSHPFFIQIQSFII